MDTIEDLCKDNCKDCGFFSRNPEIGTEKFPWYCSKYNQVFSEPIINNDSNFKQSFKNILESKTRI